MKKLKINIREICKRKWLKRFCHSIIHPGERKMNEELGYYETKTGGSAFWDTSSHQIGSSDEHEP